MAILELLIGLLIAYLLFYGLVDHLLRRRFGDAQEGSSGAPTSTSRSQPPTALEAGTRDSRSSSTLVCRVCGTENGSGYTYCRNCIVELDGF